MCLDCWQQYLWIVRCQSLCCDQDWTPRTWPTPIIGLSRQRSLLFVINLLQTERQLEKELWCQTCCAFWCQAKNVWPKIFDFCPEGCSICTRTRKLSVLLWSSSLIPLTSLFVLYVLYVLYICMYIHTYVCMYVFMYVCMYIYHVSNVYAPPSQPTLILHCISN